MFDMFRFGELQAISLVVSIFFGFIFFKLIFFIFFDLADAWNQIEVERL